MTKTKGFLLTAGIVLATTFTLSCSDDKEEGGGSYLSCEELGSLMGGNPDAYWDNVMNSCETEHMTELQNCKDKQCAKNIIFACMLEDEKVKKVCGGNGLEACGNHYDTTCGTGK